jgi:hypothetical protein
MQTRTLLVNISRVYKPTLLLIEEGIGVRMISVCSSLLSFLSPRSRLSLPFDALRTAVRIVLAIAISLSPSL